ncbi:MAG: hypothetical protein ACTSQ7_05590 [Alphaproteobacteria bacterium]
MLKSIPIDGEQVARAAEVMIAQHGNFALAQADKQIDICESKGFGHMASTWKLIRETIRDAQQSDTTAEGYMTALNKGVLLSE